MHDVIFFQAEVFDFQNPKTNLVGKINGSELVRLQYKKQEESKVAGYIINPKVQADFLLAPDYKSDLDSLAKLTGSLAFEEKHKDGIWRGISLERLRSLKILDLGCGSEISDSETRGMFAPILCRDLFYLGVDVTGVDINYPNYDRLGEGIIEPWKYHQLNLRKQDALSIFGKDTFDVIWANGLIADGEALAVSPTFYGGRIDAQEYQNLESRIFLQSLSALKTGGVFIANCRHIYQKTQDGLSLELQCISDPQRRVLLSFLISLC